MQDDGEHPTAPAVNSVLCRLSDIPDGGCRGFPDEDPAEFVLVRSGDRVYAYRNCCPHTGAAMEWQRHQFLDLDGRHICCAVHGALFRIEDGYCVSGPCARRSLTAVPVRVQDGLVLAAGSNSPQ